MPISKSSNKRIGITLGDPAGIGPEITAMALAKSRVRNLGDFIVIGDQAAYQQYNPSKFRNCSFADLPSVAPSQTGVPSQAGARSSLDALNAAIGLLKKKKITSLVTAPVCKETISRIDPSFRGHTEFLSDAFGIKTVGMMFVADQLRTVIVTRHIPLNRVSTAITASNIFETLLLTDHALKKTFKIKKPVIAVCGLNPHAGEGGTIGKEETTKIIPAIRRAQRHKIIVHGPFAADTLFSKKISCRFDAIVAMYHDQGLIPVKALYFTKLVNLTIGLPFIRTSPAHGTAFDIAGKGKADPSSMCEAIKMAAGLFP